MNITLNKDEADWLNTPVVGSGGFQSLARKLQKQFNPATNELTLDADDIARIKRYAKNYGTGGWQGRLIGALSKHLGIP